MAFRFRYLRCSIITILNPLHRIYQVHLLQLGDTVSILLFSLSGQAWYIILSAALGFESVNYLTDWRSSL